MPEHMKRGPVLNGALASPATELKLWGGSAVYDIALTLADRDGKYRRFRAHKRVSGEYVYNVMSEQGDLK